MKNKWLLACAAASVLSTATAGFAMQATQRAPATQPIPKLGDALSVTVAAVNGNVQYRESDTDVWKPARVGLVVGEGAEFRTAFRSQVQLTLPPNQTITLDRVGAIKVLQAIKQSKMYKTDIGMKYGRLQYDVQAAGIEHESTVHSPNATLSARGTGNVMADERPFAPQVFRYDGVSEWISGGHRQIIGRQGNAKAVGDQQAAETAVLTSVVDPNIAFARTPNEVPLVTNLLSRGAVFQLGNNKEIAVVRGGVPPQTDKQLIPILPGVLDIVLRWDGPANLDLTVGNQAGNGGKGEAVYPATSANWSKSGGYIPFDHQGGKFGGIELAYWRSSYPISLYFLGVTNVSGATVHYTLDVFVNGKRANIFDPVTATNVTTLSGTIAKGEQQGGIGQVGVNIPAAPASKIATVTRVKTVRKK